MEKKLKLEEYSYFYHVDISTQINNKWKEDSVLGILKDSERYSIKIKGNDKEKIKNRYILDNDTKSNNVHNNKVICIIYSYLLYKLLSEFEHANPILLCRDVRPERYVMNYLQKISSYFNNRDILNRKINFRKRIEFETKNKLPKSLAGKFVRKVYQGKIPANKTLDNQEIDELIIIIGKII